MADPKRVRELLAATLHEETIQLFIEEYMNAVGNPKSIDVEKLLNDVLTGLVDRLTRTLSNEECEQLIMLVNTPEYALLTDLLDSTQAHIRGLIDDELLMRGIAVPETATPSDDAMDDTSKRVLH